ncbi:MAG TPA: hypothetical protein PKG95_00765 [Anaerolineaceae bacterium]|jgi:hypothetical protein|nr:hypothetical protein [Anaerolineaceae bacterium]
MTQNLDRISIKRKTGTERFHANGQEFDFDLLSFWQWVDSDLVNNALRGELAEYIVARALHLDTSQPREGWAAYDLETPSGIKIEVKSAAYLQSWHQNRMSDIMFKVPKTRYWDAATNRQAKEKQRQADVYVFALLAHQDKQTIDPLNIDQWVFYVLPTAVLNERKRSQYGITLKSLVELCGRSLTFSQLQAAVETAAGQPIE